MLLLFFQLSVIAGLVLIATLFIWSRIKFSWLENLTSALFLSFPFERLPSLEIGGVSVRLSFALVVLGFYILLVLVLKKDQKIINLKISKFFVWVVVFWVALIPSIFLAINQARLIQTLLATALVFGGAFLVAHFLPNIRKNLYRLTLILSCLSVFGLYQFIGDFIGLSTDLTLLREQYTKKVFGFARIQSTALEPLYWGGMLILPLILICGWLFLKRSAMDRSAKSELFEQTTVSKNDIFLYSDKILKLDSLFKSKIFLILIGSLIFLNLALTLSRGAYIAASFALLIFFILAYRYLSMYRVITWLSAYALTGIVLLASSISLVGSAKLLESGLSHVLNVFSPRQASTAQRLDFLSDALSLTYNNVLIGIGSGNYGPRVQANVVAEDGGWKIVNNVYLEIWLELGLSALLVFAGLLATYLNQATRVLLSWKHRLFEHPEKAVILSALIASVAGYLVQWLTFSPVFIMPFFILFGLLVRLVELPDPIDQ